MEEKRLDALIEQKERLADRVDVFMLEDYGSFKKIDAEGNNLFGFVATSVWNARKHMVDC